MAARQSNGGEIRIRAARFPARKTFEEFDFDHQRSLKRESSPISGHSTSWRPRTTSSSSAHRAPEDPSGHRTVHPGLPGRAPRAVRHRGQWVDRLGQAHDAGQAPRGAHPAGPLSADRHRRGRLHPLRSQAANLFFQLVSSRYERASIIVTSNKPFGRWGEVFGDAVVAAAMIDRLVHHAEVVSMKGDSYRLKDRDLGRVPTDDARDGGPGGGSIFNRWQGVSFGAVLTLTA